MLDGIDFYNVSNREGGMSPMLTGSPGTATDGMSGDKCVARESGGETPFSLLEPGVLSLIWGVNSQTVMCDGPCGTLVPADDDPRLVYGRLFGRVAAPTPTPPRCVRRIF